MSAAAQLKAARRVSIVRPGRGDIGDALVGRRVSQVLRNASHLIIRCDDGVELRVAWRDERGRSSNGVPMLEEITRW